MLLSPLGFDGGLICRDEGGNHGLTSWIPLEYIVTHVVVHADSMAMSSRTRPEEQAPPDVYYNEAEAEKYLHNSRMIEVQATMAERALEMLCLSDSESSVLLDVGCGTGLSGEALEEYGHTWVGVDISRDMLSVAQRREVEGDLVHQDMGLGMPFREGVFDGAISISAVQWLCYSDRNSHDPRMRLHRFFQSLYKCLRRGARAVLQFYPQDAAQLQLITASAMRAGFGGGLVVDFPNSTKAKKYFLVLLAGQPDAGFQMPQALGEGGAQQATQTEAANEGRKQHAKRRIDSRLKGNRRGQVKKTREWLVHKKEIQRAQGKEVAFDSKYTGRKRSKVRF